MEDEKRFLVDVGLQNLPFPMTVTPQRDAESQSTVANISVKARILREFEARWIDKFIQILHQHRGFVGTHWLDKTIPEYAEVLHATNVTIDCDYPIFLPKYTPITRQQCLVHYRCTYSTRSPLSGPHPVTSFKIEIPCITTYPIADAAQPGGLFGQISVVCVEVRSEHDVFAEDLVAMVDGHALAPVYSFLTEEDQIEIIKRIHSQKKTSVILVDEVKADLARSREITWAKVHCTNFGMLHSYSTVIQTEKSRAVPFSGCEDDI